jgi:small subunit ribosomal protein S20
LTNPLNPSKIDSSAILLKLFQGSAKNSFEQEQAGTMANHFSALKRARQTGKRTANNRAHTSRLRSALRDLRQTIQSGDSKQAKEALSSTVSMIDKAVKKGVIHKNTGSRYKSRLSARVAAVK